MALPAGSEFLPTRREDIPPIAVAPRARNLRSNQNEPRPIIPDRSARHPLLDARYSRSSLPITQSEGARPTPLLFSAGFLVFPVLGFACREPFDCRGETLLAGFGPLGVRDPIDVFTPVARRKILKGRRGLGVRRERFFKSAGAGSSFPRFRARLTLDAGASRCCTAARTQASRRESFGRSASAVIFPNCPMPAPALFVVGSQRLTSISRQKNIEQCALKEAKPQAGR